MGIVGQKTSDAARWNQWAYEMGFAMFGMWRAGKTLEAHGIRALMKPANSRAFEGLVSDYFQNLIENSEGLRLDNSPSILVGAMPFDNEREGFLIAPDRLSLGEDRSHLAPAVAALGVDDLQKVVIRNVPEASVYAQSVRNALSLMDGSALRKVVLARRLHVSMPQAISREALVARLMGDGSVTTFRMDIPEKDGVPATSLVGATPELLIARDGLNIRSHPLAGSARRLEDPVADRLAGEALLRSEKDLREHAVVVEAILDTLSPYCSEISAPNGTCLTSTATMWHLGTPIAGRLKSADAPTAAGLAALLHPTPAVGGDPRDLALDAIRALEGDNRGFYAGALGWVDSTGDGEWYVTLRCAEVSGSEMTLYAGAGVVLGSDPDAEVAETSAKFRAMLQALGIHERGDTMEAAA